MYRLVCRVKYSQPCAEEYLGQKVCLTACACVKTDSISDMLLVEKTSRDDIQPILQDLEHPQHLKHGKIHVVEVWVIHRGGICSETRKKTHEQHRTLLEYLENAGYADVQLHLLIVGSTRSTDGQSKVTSAWRKDVKDVERNKIYRWGRQHTLLHSRTARPPKLSSAAKLIPLAVTCRSLAWFPGSL